MNVSFVQEKALDRKKRAAPEAKDRQSSRWKAEEEEQASRRKAEEEEPVSIRISVAAREQSRRKKQYETYIIRSKD